jgi:Cysteine rich repeat
MLRTLCLIVTLLASSSPAWTQNGHTPAEEKACRGDAHRFCKDDLGDEFQTASCLQDHRAQLSRACRAVLENHGQ